MRPFLLISFTLFFCSALCAQNSGLASYSIFYGFNELSDHEAVLYFNGEKSYFETKAGPNNTFVLVLHDTLKSNPSRFKNTVPNYTQVYTNLKENILITSNHLVLSDVYFTLEKPKPIKWEIHNDTKEIGEYLCQKATGHFRGRDYEAWFTKEIPVEFGPWKFNGLPGLIVEVKEKNNHIHILLNTLNTPFEQEIVSLESDNYYAVPEYLSLFKKEVMNLIPDHPARHLPNVIYYVDISKFTELE